MHLLPVASATVVEGEQGQRLVSIAVSQFGAQWVAACSQDTVYMLYIQRGPDNTETLHPVQHFPLPANNCLGRTYYSVC
ncbi:hypothetical protein KIPB_012340 [Kipferlia bialata]|uniref:Uncharacterized protein n=1 Tax=Kipferlia bialata TaxID=797122 RepID=A0A391NQY8_9EUKA|nr:hypothetical protein KIPB_012340 [Kipferlia bialata]|eukprot:g12340.t1